jgi:hypothetical protein
VIVTAGLGQRRLENTIVNPYVGSAGVRFVARRTNYPNEPLGTFPTYQDTLIGDHPVDLVLAVPV